MAKLKDTDQHFAIKAVKKLKLIEDEEESDFLMVEKRLLELGQNHLYITQLHGTFQMKAKCCKFTISVKKIAISVTSFSK